MPKKIPSVHLNGSSKQELLRVHREAHRAVARAIDALCSAAPNARDYYVQDDNAFVAAAHEHTGRFNALCNVRDELSAILDGIRAQGKEAEEQ